MLELFPRQIAVLERLASLGFAIVEFPLYASAVGVRRGDCAALISPVGHDGFQLFGDPCYLVMGKLSVRVHRSRREWFVWKTNQIEATPQRLAELQAFGRALADALAAHV